MNASSILSKAFSADHWEEFPTLKFHRQGGYLTSGSRRLLFVGYNDGELAVTDRRPYLQRGGTMTWQPIKELEYEAGKRTRLRLEDVHIGITYVVHIYANIAGTELHAMFDAHINKIEPDDDGGAEVSLTLSTPPSWWRVLQTAPLFVSTASFIDVTGDELKLMGYFAGYVREADDPWGAFQAELPLSKLVGAGR